MSHWYRCFIIEDRKARFCRIVGFALILIGIICNAINQLRH